MNILAKILLLDNNGLIIDELKQLPKYCIKEVSKVECVSELFDYIASYDLIILNLDFNSLCGCDIVSALKSINEFKKVPIVVYSSNYNEQDIISYLYKGVDDFWTTPLNVHLISAKIDAILRRTLKPNTNIKSDLGKSLTNREIQIVELIAVGNSNKKIADKLFLSELTVKSHLKNIFKKLCVTNRTQAILAAMNKGIISHDLFS